MHSLVSSSSLSTAAYGCPHKAMVLICATECRPGQYIFLQCGDISRHEWHPFSLTSAPADNFLQVEAKSRAFSVAKQLSPNRHLLWKKQWLDSHQLPGASCLLNELVCICSCM